MMKICNVDVTLGVIACAYENGVVGLVRLSDPRQFRIIHRHISGYCFDVCSFDGLVASVGEDSVQLQGAQGTTTTRSCDSVMVYNMRTEAIYRQVIYDNAMSLCFVDEHRLAIGTTQSKVVIWNFVTNVVRTLGHHGQPPDPLQTEDHKWVTSLCIIDEGLLASGCQNNTAIIWNIDTRAILHTFEHPKEVLSLCLVPSGTSPRLLCGWGSREGGGLGGITLWDVNTGERIRTYQHHSSVSSMTLLLNDCFAVASEEASDIKILSLENQRSMLF